MIETIQGVIRHVQTQHVSLVRQQDGLVPLAHRNGGLFREPGRLPFPRETSE